VSKKYKLYINSDALTDIQEATDWYNHQLKGLGARYQEQVKKQINSLSINPNIYKVRYDKVRCMLIKKFPFLVHYTVDESSSSVIIYAVLHTSRDPEIWKKKRR
jgi:plasmid stabilization system protein ParE